MSKREQNKSLLPQLPGVGGGFEFRGLPKTEKTEDLKGKFKRSGHVTDQLLRYNYPKDNSKQTSIFDALKDSTKKDIEVAGVEFTEVVEGIKLSPSETKVIDSLCKLLHHNSQTVEPTEKNYYTGNLNPELVEYGDSKTSAPKLAFTLYELTKEYLGIDKKVAGKDIQNVKKILTELDNKRFLVRYIETTHKKGGGRIEKQIEDFSKIINIIKIKEYDKNNNPIDLKHNDTEVLLNPIFRRQIDSKFILYPNDINKRTIIAYGSHNVSDITIRLRDYLMRLLSSPKMSREIMLDRLYYLVSEKWMRESRKKKVKQYTEKALEVVIELGLLESYKVVKAKTTGEPKIVFTLNKDFE